MILPLLTKEGVGGWLKKFISFNGFRTTPNPSLIRRGVNGIGYNTNILSTPPVWAVWDG
jgi:hypothetical protein